MRFFGLTETVTIRLSKEMAQRVREAAIRDGRTVSGFWKRAMDTHLEAEAQAAARAPLGLPSFPALECADANGAADSRAALGTKREPLFHYVGPLRAR